MRTKANGEGSIPMNITSKTNRYTARLIRRNCTRLDREVRILGRRRGAARCSRARIGTGGWRSGLPQGRGNAGEGKSPNGPAIEEEQLARPVLCPTQQATELLFRRAPHARERNPPIAQYSSFVLSPRNAYHSHEISSIVDTNVYHHEHAQTSSK